MGGSDQWGNIVTGTELIRRKGGNEAFALTAPLITKSDGTKFGKSEGNNVWLDRNKTTPYQFYQFWLNISDEEAKKFIKIFTLKSQSEIEALVIEHDAAPHLRILQKTLAYDFTSRVHSAIDTEKAIQVTNLLFGNAGKEDVMKLTAADWAEMDGVPRYELKKEALVEEVSLIDFLSERTGIFASKGEAKRNLSENSISINKEKVTVEQKLSVEFLLCDRYILVQKGKRNYYLVEAR
jgi:tyrosyl-tRNA synthetase